MSEQKNRQQEFMLYAGCISGPPDLSSRRGFETGAGRRGVKGTRRAPVREEVADLESVYLLYHLHKEDEDGDVQLLLIGAYRSEGDAKSAIARLRGKPGFSQYPDGFEYHAYKLGVENWSDGF